MQGLSLLGITGYDVPIWYACHGTPLVFLGGEGDTSSGPGMPRRQAIGGFGFFVVRSGGVVNAYRVSVAVDEMQAPWRSIGRVVIIALPRRSKP